MRILTVCVSTQVFGAEIITLKMLEGFKRAGHEQLAITTIWTDGEFNRKLAAIGINEIRLPFGFLSKVLRPQPLWWTAQVLACAPLLWLRWRRTVSQFRPDVIFFTTFRQPLLLYPALHASPSFLIEFTNLGPTPIRKQIYRLLARKLTGFVAVSNYMRGRVQKVGAPQSQVHVVRSAAFSKAELEALKSDTGRGSSSDSEALRVGIAGQISQHKGYDCLAEAVKLLMERGRALRVSVFGSGENAYVSDLRARILAMGIDNSFLWMGYTSEKAAIYRNIDVCVIPSCFGDPLPTVAMEAAAYGRPVVASRVGGLPELVEDGVTGWLVEPNSPTELAGRLEWMADNPVAAISMGNAGREKMIREFTQEKMISDFESLFQSKPIPLAFV